MKLAENVAMLSVPVNFNPEFVLNIVLLWDNDNLVLIDAGYAGQEDAIAEAIKNTGHDIKDLTHIIVTHQDLDHIGCINSLRKVAPNVKVLAHVDEAPYIDGRKVAVKVEEALKRLETSPLEAQKEIKEYAKRYEEARTKIDQELVDGEILPICGGIKVIHV
ncbi:MAG: MBL fold metallo-hydrolase, partial [Defluviitaleaceae bacterium]|nr:MBL fold metallo-hydrolase [Defluviitaleaceae bacterium]